MNEFDQYAYKPEQSTKDCPTCGHNLSSDSQKLAEMHGWLAEIMPFARMAMKMMNARHNLMSRWLPGVQKKG